VPRVRAARCEAAAAADFDGTTDVAPPVGNASDEFTESLWRDWRRFQTSRATRYRTLAADGRRETTRIATTAAAAID
jgi:hypothetical protein